MVLSLLGALRVALELAYDYLAVVGATRAIFAIHALWLGAFDPECGAWRGSRGITGVSWGHVATVGAIVTPAGVVVTRSKIVGTISTDENSTGFSFAISDSEVNAGNEVNTGIGAVNFTATRVHVFGGNRSIHCFLKCTVTDSYVHGQFTDSTGAAHESGIRMGQNATIRHNTILCDAPDVPPDAGCSADLTGYGDYAPVRNNLIEANLFKASTGGYCAYGGSSLGKPFSGQTQGIVFRNNTFEHGSGGKCDSFGPITSFDTSLPGNIWTGNVWDDGKVVPAAK